MDYAVRLARLRPDLAPSADAITRLYVALRYGSGEDRRAVDELRRQVRQFRA
ncbi:MAG: DUF4129 domain-containing protein [Betaproteobacteria bacterium]|nr:DUF4129 domain-containing protein [Betaproteobacteria bacterium]